MSTASDLLAAIQLHPDEDTPRLIYADYLDENDQSERAEFIRIQIERARLPYWELRTKQIWHRERVLLAHHGQEWYRELGTIEGVEWGRFERGFVCTVRIPSMKILRRAANAFRAVAPIENIVFTSGDTTDDGPPLRLDWVRGIELSGYNLYDDDQDNVGDLEDDPYASRGSNRAIRLSALLDSGITGNLHRLSLQGQGIENPGAMAIARATHLTQLRELDLTQCFVGNAGVAALSGAKHLASLETLIFRSGGSGYVEDPFVTDDGIARLAARESVLRSLRKLDLSGSRISDQGVQLLLTSPSFAHLEEVSLNTYDCTSRGFDVGSSLARWKTFKMSGFAMQDELIGRFNELPQLNSLAVLNARGCQFTPSGVRMLAQAPFASHLRTLDLSGNGFGSEGVRELATGNWEHLHTLNLTRNKIDYKGVEELAKTGRFPSLYELNLTENKIGDQGIQAITRAGWAKSLARLMLETNQISSAGIHPITASSVLCGLTDLKLDNNPIGPDGVQAIAMADWPELTDLSLKSCKASEAAILALIHRLCSESCLN